MPADLVYRPEPLVRSVRVGHDLPRHVPLPDVGPYGAEREQLKPPRLLTGNDLIAMGLEPGPRFGKILSALEDAQLEGKVKTGSQARQWVKKYLARGKGPSR